MSGNRERLAWLFLLGSFFTCVVLTVSIPLGLNFVRQKLTRPLDLQVQANQGTIAILDPDGGTDARFQNQEAKSYSHPVTLITAVADSGLVQFQQQDEGSPLTRVQIFGSTNFVVNEAVSPRFASSSAETTIHTSLNNGRIQITIPQNQPRPVSFTIETQQGIIAINQAGKYSIDVTNTETQATALTGALKLIGSNNNEMSISAEQRGIINVSGQPEGPLSPEFNLIRNGQFNDGWAEWIPGIWNIERPEEPSGDTTMTTVNEEAALRFDRNGIGHADSSVQQIINQDISGFSDLRLAVSLRIQSQSLDVCGINGTECPIIVRIEFDDENGSIGAWQQGFYAKGEPGTGTPNFCRVCSRPLNLSEHQFLNRLNEIVFYESGNLLELLQQDGIHPVRIKNLVIIASGHSFGVDLLDISLIADE